jgi:hypothetical protein
MNVAHEPLLRHTALAQASYHDLLRSLIDESLSAIRGTPRLETRLGRYYWYDVYRLGSSVRKRYLGEDTPETAGRIAAHRQLAATRSARAYA